MNQPAVDKQQENSQTYLTFDYVKSNLFRTIHADGLVGSFTPSSDIYIAFFNERFPIPQQLVFELQSDGTIGDEITELRRSRDSVLREMEIGITMTVDVAESLVEYLKKMIEATKEN